MDPPTRKEFEKLKTDVEKKFEKIEKIADKKKKPREPSEYNIFVGEECKKIRAKKEYKDLPHSEIFKLAVEKWNTKKKK
jgi:hypothetical protein